MNGNFAVDTAYGLKAMMLFMSSEKGGAIVVMKLAIAQKESMALTDGFIFAETQEKAERPAGG